MQSICFSLPYYFFHYSSKKGSRWEGGIDHIYHDPCEDWLDLLLDMKLTSPNYPNPYDPLTNCKWNITAPQGYFVTLSFETIDVCILELWGISYYTKYV